MIIYTITINSIGNGNEIEWTEIITSAKSLRGAKTKASLWISKNLFALDIDHIEKEQVSQYSRRATWWIY